MTYPIKTTLIAYTAYGRDAQRPDVRMDKLIVMPQGDQSITEIRRRILDDLHRLGWSHVVLHQEPEVTVIQDAERLYWRGSNVHYTLAEADKP